MRKFNFKEQHVIKKFIYLIVTGLVACVVTACQGHVEGSDDPTTERPNILWIMAEDMGPELGLYGTPEVTTPVIDALADDGMTFNNAFANGPICSISRSSLFTGMYQTTIGAHQHRTLKENKTPLPQGVTLLTDQFREAGYYTALLTKVGRDDVENAWLNPKAKTDWNFLYDGEPYDGNDIKALKDNQPFFAHIQFAETHRGRDWDDAVNKISFPANPDKVAIPPYYPDHPIVREDWADYLNAVMAFDLKTGFVLQRLKEEGLAENTIVIVLADHGRAMVRGKQWLYDSGLHIPLIIYIPKDVTMPTGFLPGEQSEQLVSGIDIAATTLALGNAYTEEKLQGLPFLGRDSTKREYQFAARDRADETSDYMRSVRSDRYLYIRNFYPERPYTQFNAYKETEYAPYRLMFRLHNEGKLGPVPSLFFASTKPEQELYDVKSDPHNINNLAADPAYADVLNNLRARLEAWQVETGDMGRVPEDPSIARAIAKKGLRKRKSQIEELIEKEGLWRIDGIPKP